MNRSRQSGFSLIELIIVIAIIGIISSLVTMNMHFLQSISIRTGIEKLVSTCLLAQQLAMAHNKEQMIEIDINTNSYCLGKHVEYLPHGIRFGIIPHTKGPPSNPTTVLSDPVTFRGHHIIFYPDGIIQSGTMYLVNEHVTTMYAVSNAVSHISYLRMYRYDGTWRSI